MNAINDIDATVTMMGEGSSSNSNSNSNGDVLMLEAPPSYGSSSHSDAEIIDALPYIDDDYSDPRVKIEVDRLVEEEMRRSSKKPADFLKDFPPLPSSNFQVTTQTLSPSGFCFFHFFIYDSI